MSEDLIAIIGCCILGLIAHGCRKISWLAWVIRVIIGLFFVGEMISLLLLSSAQESSPWSYQITLLLALSTGLLLFKPVRRLVSVLLTVPNQFVSGRPLLAALGKLSVDSSAASVFAPTPVIGATTEAKAQQPITPANQSAPPAMAAAAPGTAADASGMAADAPGMAIDASGTAADASTCKASDTAASAITPVSNQPAPAKMTFLGAFTAERIFVPESIPHMNGLWLYLSCLAFLLAHTELSGFQMPAIMIPIPATFDQLFSYNFFGLVFLAFCGVGIFVFRSPLASLKRLGLEKPTLRHVLIGLAMIVVTFSYDYFWSLNTHEQAGLGYKQKLTHYNEGTFTTAGGAGSALALATATGFCAGFGEEILCRGALQPVFGILPAAFLHGVLHGQFAHAPMLILQVFGWSTLMGIVRRYTNTTTTIIAHAGFNFLSTFLFAFNP